jgi:hypothetical protein
MINNSCWTGPAPAMPVVIVVMILSHNGVRIRAVPKPLRTAYRVVQCTMGAKGI